MTKLVITRSQLSELMYDNLDEFEVLNDDIPKDGHSSQYIEDDGRQYRHFEFKRLLDGEIFNFSYTWNPEFSFEPTDIFDSLSDLGIELIDDPVEKPEPEPEPILTPEQQADKEIMQTYNDSEPLMKPIDDVKDNIPVSVIDDVISFVNSGKFNMYELRGKLIPVCIKYNVEQKSFWTYIQRKRGAWL